MLYDDGLFYNSDQSCPFVIMAIEIEKKYRLTPKQREEVLIRLPELGATRESADFEINTLYSGDSIDSKRAVLRLRRIGERGILTFKERLPSDSPIKHQLEDETTVGDPDAMDAILESLGFNPTLIYEKRRERWLIGDTEVVIDELPFGLFMEIEGEEHAIKQIEKNLAIKRLKSETATYPLLTREHGIETDGVVEARFAQGK
jgi:adenylate cyclase class 2